MKEKRKQILTISLTVLVIALTIFFLFRENWVVQKTEAIPGNISSMPSFNLEDIEGNKVSSDIFGDYDLTIVSIWQTTCKPCFEELQALETIYEEYKDKGVNVVGISVDGGYNIEGAKEIVKQLNINFTTIITDEDYINELMKFVKGTPAAYFVDKEGNFVGGGVKAGSLGKDKDIEFFRNKIEEIINK